jgi:hypothetical protein
LLPKWSLTSFSFGWVNASFVHGLSLIPKHMQRALGTLTEWETFRKATEIKLNGFEDGLIRENSREGSSADEASSRTASASDESRSFKAD